MGTPAIVLLFAGQGSHFARMGSVSFKTDPVFRDCLFKADRLVRAQSGVDLIDTIFADGDAWLTDLTISHPAIFAMQWASAESLRAQGLEGNACLGASLGEYVALGHAGAATFSDMLELVMSQARTAVDRIKPGGMMTILASADFFYTNAELFNGCTLAAENFDRHIVVAGDHKAIEACRAAMDSHGISAFPLNVPFGFHSPSVDTMKDEFLGAAGAVALAPPEKPIYGCCLAGGTVRPDAAHLWQIVERPIYFERTVHAIERDMDLPLYIDCSPSGTLANFLTYLLGPEHRDRMLALHSPGRATTADWRTFIAGGQSGHRRRA